MAYPSRQPSGARKEFDDTNRGILFKNDRKENEKHPDYKGTLNVDGVEFWISGWRKDTKKGPALSLSVQPKQEARRETYNQQRQYQPTQSEDPFDL